LINKYEIIGAAAGSLFVFKSYPNRAEKDTLLKQNSILHEKNMRKGLIGLEICVNLYYKY
jgi:hypothetical protein